MTATATRQPELVLAQEIIAFANKGDVRGALARAERASLKYPNFRLPAIGDAPTPTFAEIAVWLKTKLPQKAETPAPQAQSAEPAPKKAAPKKAAPVAKSAPVKAPEPVAVTTLRLVHNGTDPTSIYGMAKGSPAQIAIGKKANGGLGWLFWGSGPCFYISKSGGYAPDYREINLAISRLESLKSDDGQQLYRVVPEIVTEVGGKTLPVRMTAAQRAEWQRAYDAARNSLGWNLSMGHGTCGKCGVRDLAMGTGRMGKGDDGMPMVECHTCGGFAAPEAVVVTVPDLSSLLALTTEPAPMPESAQCGTCRQLVPVVNGRLDLHNARYGNKGACRGKLGVTVTDVEPEPVTPVKAAPRKAVKAKAAPVVSVVVPEPETVEEPDGALVKFALQGGLSGSARNAIAVEVRQALTRKITYGRAFRGVKLETRRDKVNHRLVLTVTEGDGFDAAELTDAVAAVVKSVRGIGNRVNR